MYISLFGEKNMFASRKEILRRVTLFLTRIVPFIR